MTTELKNIGSLPSSVQLWDAPCCSGRVLVWTGFIGAEQSVTIARCSDTFFIEANPPTVVILTNW